MNLLSAWHLLWPIVFISDVIFSLHKLCHGSVLLDFPFPYKIVIWFSSKGMPKNVCCTAFLLTAWNGYTIDENCIYGSSLQCECTPQLQYLFNHNIYSTVYGTRTGWYCPKGGLMGDSVCSKSLKHLIHPQQCPLVGAAAAILLPWNAKNPCIYSKMEHRADHRKLRPTLNYVRWYIRCTIHFPS